MFMQMVCFTYTYIHCFYIKTSLRDYSVHDGMKSRVDVEVREAAGAGGGQGASSTQPQGFLSPVFSFQEYTMLGPARYCR